MIERQNYLRVNEYLTYLKEVMQLSQSSVERYRFYLRHLLLWAGGVHFNNAQKIRPALPKHISLTSGKTEGKPLAACTQKKILDTSRRFFNWAKSKYPKEFSDLTSAWIDTLRLIRQPQKTVEHVYVSEEEVRKLIAIPANESDLALMRDKAAAAFLFLSGMRGSAFVTLPLAALDLEKMTVLQWPELGVHTKNGTKATTFLFNIPDLLVPIRRWDSFIRTQVPKTARWYAPIKNVWGEQNISEEMPGKNRLNALEKRIKELFALAKLPYKSPHKFRHGNAVYGLLHAKTVADYKAVSMNLMHESIETTDNTYAPLISSDVQTRITNLSQAITKSSDPELERYLNSLGNEALGKALILIAERLIK